MENGRIINASVIQDGFMMTTLDEEEPSITHNDITTKRLKNRERQRRYRARKRLEADMKKASVTNQPTPPQVEVELNGHHNNYITPIPCKRNWKKDARRAHACKNLEETHNVAVISALPLNIESQTVWSAPRIMTGTPQERKIHSENSVSLWSSETHENKFGRRDWKAEARTRIGGIKDIASKLTIAYHQFCCRKNIKYQKLSLESCLNFKASYFDKATSKFQVLQFKEDLMARPLFNDRRKFSKLADSRLQGRYPMRGLYQALDVASMCIQEQAAARPLIGDVVTALSYLANQAYGPNGHGHRGSGDRDEKRHRDGMSVQLSKIEEGGGSGRRWDLDGSKKEDSPRETARMLNRDLGRERAVAEAKMWGENWREKRRQSARGSFGGSNG